MAKCPAHDDHNPSLSIRQKDGKILVHCHAGCSQDAAIAALKARGLWQAEDAANRRFVTAYGYTDEKGELLYEVVRYEPKDFKQRRPDGLGGWIWKKGERQVLYRLTEVLEAPIVFVVEGEKDVETLREHGFVATTSAGGAKAQWLPSYTQTLAGREVILIPDADEPGRLRVLKIARALVGHASAITVFEPVGAKDIGEWFERGHSEVELIEKVERALVPR
jgi:hypothetical protein